MEMIWVITTVFVIFSTTSFCFPNFINYSSVRCLNDPPSIDHGRFESNFGLHSSTAFYECDEGFSLTESDLSTVRCNFGKWEGIPPTCKDDRCFSKDLQRTDGLVMDNRPTLSYNRLVVNCADGYTSTHEEPLCLKGEWMPHDELCRRNIRMSCDRPRGIKNGRILSISLTFGSQIHYKCNDGFVMKQHQTRICLENGTWTGDDPICKVAQCDPPETPENGFVEVIGDRLSVGSKAIYSCDGDLVLTGSNTSVCLRTEKWSSPTPKCLEPCTVPNITHGKLGRYEKSPYSNQLNFKELSIGTKIEKQEDIYLQCEDKYDALGMPSTEEYISCSSGVWSDFPRCEPASCTNKPPETKSSFFASINWKHGGAVDYRCLRYFVKTQMESVACDFGSWIGNTPVCTDTRCYVKDNFLPELVKGNKRIFFSGQSFSPACNRQQIDNKLVCENGAWTGRLIPCAIDPCSIPKVPHGRIGRLEMYDLDKTRLVELFVDTKVESGVELYVQCENNYEVLDKGSSDVQITCNNGEWNTSPLCEPAICRKQPPTIKHGWYKPPSALHNSTVTYECGVGFALRETSKVQCLFGKWNGRPPTCESMPDCDLEQLFTDLPLPVTLDADDVGTLPYMSTVSLECLENKVLVGSDTTVRCGTNGTWEIPDVECIPGCAFIKSSDPYLVMEPVKSVYRIGEFITFYCPPGSVLSSDVVRVMCINSGWSERAIPHCKE